MMKEILLKASENKTLEEFASKSKLIQPLKKRFIGGETMDEIVIGARRLNEQGMAVIINPLGEHVTSEADVLRAQGECLDLIEVIHKENLGAGIALKPSYYGLGISPQFYEGTVSKILDKTSEYEIFARIDMEGSAYTQSTLDVFYKLNKRYKNVEQALQAYLYRTRKDVQDAIKQQAQISLCLGAYKEDAAIAYQKKEKVVENFRMQTATLISRGKTPAVASQNEGILERVEQFPAAHRIPSNHIHEMLFGVRRDLQLKIVKNGEILRIYFPVSFSGKPDWYPYLMRRMAERPENLLFFLSNLFKR